MLPVMLFLPVPPPANPPYAIHQTQQYRDFDQWTDSRRKSLIAIGAVRCDCNGNCKLKVVARPGEALRCRKLVAESEFIGDQQRQEEDCNKVYNQGRSDTDYRDNLVDDLVTLRSKQDEDGIQQPDQGPWRRPLQKGVVIPGSADEPPQDQSCNDSGAERDSEEDCDACCNPGVGHRDVARGVADDLYEEDSKRCIQHHLKDGVDCNEYSTVLVVSTS